MFDSLKKLGDINQMKQQAQKMQQELAQERIEVVRQTSAGLTKIILTGEQKVVSIEINGQRDQEFEKLLADVIYKSQMVAASKLKEMSGGLGALMG